MGNFVGPLVVGALFDVNVEFPLYMAIIVMLFGIVIILLKSTASNETSKTHNEVKTIELLCKG